jgi:hypothetical protein
VLATNWENSRILYLPSAGICLVLAGVLTHLGRRKQMLGLGGLLGFFIGGQLLNQRDWSRASELADQTLDAVTKALPLPAEETDLHLVGVPQESRGFVLWSSDSILEDALVFRYLPDWYREVRRKHHQPDIDLLRVDPRLIRIWTYPSMTPEEIPFVASAARYLEWEPGLRQMTDRTEEWKRRRTARLEAQGLVTLQVHERWQGQRLQNQTALQAENGGIIAIKTGRWRTHQVHRLVLQMACQPKGQDFLGTIQVAWKGMDENGTPGRGIFTLPVWVNDKSYRYEWNPNGDLYWRQSDWLTAIELHWPVDLYDVKLEGIDWFIETSLEAGREPVPGISD